LVSPGPIARDDADERYVGQNGNVPPSALRPGGGSRLKAIDPHRLAEKILAACRRRRPELVVPAKARLLFALSQFWPTFADWILQKQTTRD